MADLESLKGNEGEEHPCIRIAAITLLAFAAKENLAQSLLREVPIKDSDIPNRKVNPEEFYPKFD